MLLMASTYLPVKFQNSRDYPPDFGLEDKEEGANQILEVVAFFINNEVSIGLIFTASSLAASALGGLDQFRYISGNAQESIVLDVHSQCPQGGIRPGAPRQASQQIGTSSEGALFLILV